MKLKKIKIGDIVIPYYRKCGISDLTPYQVSGVNRDKEFFEPSHQVGEDTSKYQEVPEGFFACNLMHVGRDVVLPIAMNHSGKTKYVSPAYTVFSLKKDSGILKEYFFIYLKSDEKDRWFWFNTDASVRDGMSWNDFCNVEIELPDIATQQKYVDIYQAMVKNQQAYERGLEDLKTVCDGYIEDLRRKMPCEKIGKYIQQVDLRNAEGLSLEYVRGISIEKKFIDTKADMEGVSLVPYKIVSPKSFAFVPVTSRNGEKITLAYNETSNTFIVSSSYIVFNVRKEEALNPVYLFMWFNRSEFDRYTRFNSWGSARETFGWDEMCDVSIPIPNIEIQKSIADIYTVYLKRKEINEKLKAQIKDICPILIKGSLQR